MPWKFKKLEGPSEALKRHFNLKYYEIDEDDVNSLFIAKSELRNIYVALANAGAPEKDRCKSIIALINSVYINALQNRLK